MGMLQVVDSGAESQCSMGVYGVVVGWGCLEKEEGGEGGRGGVGDRGWMDVVLGIKGGEDGS